MDSAKTSSKRAREEEEDVEGERRRADQGRGSS